MARKLPPPRGVWATVWNNFTNSFGILAKRPKASVVGKDHLGTKYYEIPASPATGKRNPSRWFEATEKEKFDQEIPAEWEAWLRFRRKEPPTEQEIQKNISIQQTAIRKAGELEEKAAIERSKRGELPVESKEEKKSFPVYKDYDKR